MIDGGQPLTLDLRQIIYVLSDALDYVGIDDVRHGKRVAYMAMEIGKAGGFPPEDLEFLFDAGMLHDCGVSSNTEHRDLVDNIDWSGAEAHCVRGERLLEAFEPLAHLALAIRHHHAHWADLEEMEPRLPRHAMDMANCLYLADRVDALVAQQGVSEPILARDAVKEAVIANRGTRFSPKLVDAFKDAAARESFWFTLEPDPLIAFLDKGAKTRNPVPVTIDQTKMLAAMFARIVDAKSPYTAEHSLGVARVSRLLCERAGFDAGRCDRVQVAALLHDLGKLRVPDEVLEKPAPLDDRERAAISHHSFHTHQILTRIEGFEEIAEWAAYHHEQVTGEGYPFHLGGADLPTEARLLAVADVFQALAQDRPYRPSMRPDEILDILDGMGREGKLDPEFVALVAFDPAECWAAALRQR